MYHTECKNLLTLFLLVKTHYSTYFIYFVDMCLYLSYQTSMINVNQVYSSKMLFFCHGPVTCSTEYLKKTLKF